MRKSTAADAGARVGCRAWRRANKGEYTILRSLIWTGEGESISTGNTPRAETHICACSSLIIRATGLRKLPDFQYSV